MKYVVADTEGSGLFGYKRPADAEGQPFPILGDHSALNDARACLQLLGKMIELGVCPEPQVHLAKNPPEKTAA